MKAKGGAVFLSDVVKASDLQFISEIRDQLHFIIYVFSGSDETALATSCQLLLAGATHIMDGRSTHLLLNLAAQIKELTGRALASEADDENLRNVMATAGFAGQSAAMLSLFRNLRNVGSMTDLPVLITGETGTGKELVATAIHSLDAKRSREPFISINCATLTEHLSESELFGHQRGAFTGAERERAGIFRIADRGVLFLDEIGELSSILQGKLLRVLQTGKLRSVGSDREIAVNVRVIAATNRQLDRLVRAGEFREDLFHRLNVLSLHIPPLRERRCDVAPLVEHFVWKYASLWSVKGPPEIGSDFVQGLERASLPGNARQVENLVRRALVEWEGFGPLSLRHLPIEIWQELSVTAASASPRVETIQTEEQASPEATLELHAVQYLQRHDWNLLHATRHLESLLVQGALHAARGNQSEAARLLGITSRSVYNKLHKSCSC